MDKILITGALGQLGSELAPELQKIYGVNNVILSDVHPYKDKQSDAPFEILNVLSRESVGAVVRKYRITQIYHLAALLSARSEKEPVRAWNINMDGLLNVLEISRLMHVKKIYWPSSIGVFGPDTPRVDTPQKTVMNPTTVYGISKLAGEQWCAYYGKLHGLDTRSLRYPGLIGYKTMPGGGTTDYAVDIFFKALEGNGHYECFLKQDTRLPMMYMPDAVRGTLELMESEKKQLRIRESYNFAGISFTPGEIASAIQQYIPKLHVSYKPDFRQTIADSWPQSIDDQTARADWGWAPQYNLHQMTADIIEHLKTNHPGLMETRP